MASARGGIVSDGLLHDVPLPRRAGLQRAAQRFLVDFKMLHLGVQRYLLPRVRDRERPPSRSPGQGAGRGAFLYIIGIIPLPTFKPSMWAATRPAQRRPRL